MTPEEAVELIKYYIACSVCVSHKAEADIFDVIAWLEGLSDDRK